jgi:hypothetical protein
VFGGISGVLALTTWRSALGLCNAAATMCSAGAQARQGAASTYAAISDAGFAIGGAGVAVALVAGLTAPSPKAAALWVSPAPGGLALGGAFR